MTTLPTATHAERRMPDNPPTTDHPPGLHREPVIPHRARTRRKGEFDAGFLLIAIAAVAGSPVAIFYAHQFVTGAAHRAFDLAEIFGAFLAMCSFAWTQFLSAAALYKSWDLLAGTLALGHPILLTLFVLILLGAWKRISFGAVRAGLVTWMFALAWGTLAMMLYSRQ